MSAPGGPQRRGVARCRLALLALGGVTVGVLIGASWARAGVLTPESGGSSNANEIHSLYVVVLVIGAVIFFGVVGTLVVFLVRYRGRRGRVAEQIHGNTRLEIGWTAAAALIVVVLAALTFSKLHGIVTPPASGPAGRAAQDGALYATVDQSAPPGGGALHITVTGRQFIWRFDYPNGAYSYEQMVVPVNTTVVLDIRSADVDHSWWMPKLGGKVDAIPGYSNHTWFKITRPGVFTGQCAELCGIQHAAMIAEVDAVSPGAYQAWIARQKQLLDQAPAQRRALERQLIKEGDL